MKIKIKSYLRGNTKSVLQTNPDLELAVLACMYRSMKDRGHHSFGSQQLLGLLDEQK